MKHFEFIDFLPDSHKFDRSPGYLLHGKGSTTPGISIHFSQYYTSEVEPIMKSFGHIDRFLSESRIRDQKNFMWIDLIL